MNLIEGVGGGTPFHLTLSLMVGITSRAKRRFFWFDPHQGGQAFQLGLGLGKFELLLRGCNRKGRACKARKPLKGGS